MVKIVRFGVCVVNDSVNSFNYVTNTLQDLFSWDITQAENCTYLIDRKGEYVVKWFDSEESALYVAAVARRKGLNTKIIIDKNETI